MTVVLPPNIEAMAAQVSQQYGLPPGLLAALVHQESGGNVNARSPVGALGLTQLMPHTAAGLGVKDPFNPYQNLVGGAKYLKQQIQQFGSVPLALAAYNAGPGAVAKYRGIPPYAETQAYVKNIMAAVGQGGGAPVAGRGLQSPPGLALPPGAPPANARGSGSVLGLNSLPNLQSAVEPSGEINMQTLEQEMAQMPAHLQPENAGLPTMHPNTPVSPGASAHLSPVGAAIANAAKPFLGVPYRWGGDNPQTGLDCSAFIQQVYSRLGVKLPRVTTDQYHTGQAVGLNKLQPGDAIFTEPGRGPNGGPGHVGLYLGDGMVQQSPHTGAVNDIIPLKDYLGGGFVGARRYLAPPRQGGR